MFILVIPCVLYFLLELVLFLSPLHVDHLRAHFPESRRILDSQGRLLREVVNNHGERARWVDLEDISPLVIDATLAVEDARFFSHSGIDILSVVRAIRQNVTSGRVVSGASTITMQLSRLLFNHSHSIWGKLRQAFDALRLERAMDKNAILEQYLNRAFYGSGTVGIDAASRKYFGKPNTHLSLAEAALLAGLPKAPSHLNPVHDFSAAIERQQVVLKRMLETNKISLEQYKRAFRQPIHIKEITPKLSAMHFTDYVLSQNPPPGDVHTTLDSDLQNQIEHLVDDHVKSLMSGGLTNAAVVVLDNSDGAILAMVGSSDYWNPNSGSVNGALARRQPGSTLKPFTYALAFEKGFSPSSMVADIETQYLGKSGTLFKPKNYSGHCSGPVLMREALGRSLNIPAIRIANAVGIKDLLERLRAVGFASLDRDANYYGLGLTLGNGEVSLLELAQAYAMFARGGFVCLPSATRGPHGMGDLLGPSVLLKASLKKSGRQKMQQNAECHVIGEKLSIKRVSKPSIFLTSHLLTFYPSFFNPPLQKLLIDRFLKVRGERVFSEAVCFLITDILSDENLRIRAFGTANPLLLDFPMAIKTGTSSNWRDNWVVGYTKEYTVAVWTGDFEGAPMNQLSGTIGAGPLFHKVAHLVVQRGAVKQRPLIPEPPEGVEQIVVCSLSGKIPTEHCPNHCSVYVLKENKPRCSCDMHRLFRLDKRNGLLASDRCPLRFVEEKVFEVLPPIYAEWQASHTSQRPPTAYSPYCPPNGITANALVITRPRNGEVYLLEPGYDISTQTLQLSGEVDPVLPEVSWWLDGQKVTASSWPYEANWQMAKGRHHLVMKGGGMQSDQVEFEVR
ncbi:MAG: transglycosylase domain-containing protein [Candidatus Aminicenantes bacterium]